MKLTAASLILRGVPIPRGYVFYIRYVNWWLPEHRRVVTSGDAGLFFRTNVFTGEIGRHQIF